MIYTTNNYDEIQSLYKLRFAKTPRGDEYQQFANGKWVSISQEDLREYLSDVKNAIAFIADLRIAPHWEQPPAINTFREFIDAIPTTKRHRCHVGALANMLSDFFGRYVTFAEALASVPPQLRSGNATALCAANAGDIAKHARQFRLVNAVK